MFHNNNSIVFLHWPIQKSHFSFFAGLCIWCTYSTGYGTVQPHFSKFAAREIHEIDVFFLTIIISQQMGNSRPGSPRWVFMTSPLMLFSQMGHLTQSMWPTFCSVAPPPRWMFVGFWFEADPLASSALVCNLMSASLLVIDCNSLLSVLTFCSVLMPSDETTKLPSTWQRKRTFSEVSVSQMRSVRISSSTDYRTRRHVLQKGQGWCKLELHELDSPRK